MSEVKHEDDDLVRLKVTRHLWPEEKERADLKKKNKRLTILCYVLFLLVTLLAGGLYGALKLHRSVVVGSQATGNDKMEEALYLMTHNWFFAKDIENIDERMVDQAIDGMTRNEEDPHTDYMSLDEYNDFYQSINRNYVGIGVQFISMPDGIHMIEKIIRNSPAEKYGVQPGDIIYSVDGTLVENMSSDNIVELVQGEEGTTVHMEFLREGEIVAMDIIRAPFQNTVSAEILEGNVGYLNVVQFGDSTREEIMEELQDFNEANVDKLIIDLRDDGGGYLYSLQSVAGIFLESGRVVLIEEFADGTKQELTTSGRQLWKDKPIVILVNKGTASAAEAFAIAMRELYPNVTIVGTQTYGKGTVQVSYTFGDGSAVKYTTSKWLSPKGTWVNQVGIEPDEIVEIHPAITQGYYDMEDGTIFEVDSVSSYVETIQKAFNYLEYDIDRQDGYFSTKTKEIIEQFQSEHGLDVTGKLDERTYQTILSTVIYDWNTTHNHDAQILRALEILNG